MSLTKYPAGSLRELWSISFPLMLTSLSILAMVFVDRLFLANLSEQALGAAVTAGTTFWAIGGSLVILASMAEVFVAQYNGAGHLKRLGKPVWQMIWLSLGSLVVLIPLALWGKFLIFPESARAGLEREYFQWLTLFGFSWPLLGACAAFFIGRGKTRLLVVLSLCANGINVLLDWMLIFGVEGLIPPLGMKGAAIATSVGNLLQVAVLLWIFLWQKNREEYGTAVYRFDKRELFKCLKVGVPPATLFFVETIGFAIFYMMISTQGDSQIFVAGIAQSVLILFFFVAEGVGRGATAVAGNLIGGQRHSDVYKVLRAGLKLHVIFFAIASIFLVIFPELVMDLFVAQSGTLMQEVGGIIPLEAAQVTLRICLFYLLFEGIRWLISGILTSAGDTTFLMIIGVLAVPLFLLFPTYMVVFWGGKGVEASFLVAVGFSFLVSTIFLWRLFTEKWRQIQLIT